MEGPAPVWSRRESDAVYTEQVRTTYAHLPRPLSTTVLNSVLVSSVLISVVSQSGILISTGLISGLSVVRFAAWHTCTHLNNRSSHRAYWAHLPTAFSVTSGALWGCTI